MVRIISNNSGGAGIFVIFLGLLLIGTMGLVSVFIMGGLNFSKNNLQNILDIATDRASLEFIEDTEEALYLVGEGYTMSGEKTHHYLQIDKEKAENKFYEEINKNISSDTLQAILLTPINFDGTTYTIYLDNIEHNVNNIPELTSLINGYMNSKNINHSLNISNRQIDRPTFLAVIEFTSPIIYSEPIILHSFSGSQLYRKY